ncbi:MAG: VOC family protein [Acidobacteriota bacterium]
MHEASFLAGLTSIVLVAFCATTSAKAESPARPEIELNFLLVFTPYLEESIDFYTGTMGIELASRGAVATTLFDDWEGPQSPALRGLNVEMFQAGRAVSSDRSWGRGQAVRAVIRVRDLDRRLSELRQRGVRFTSPLVERPWGRQIELTAGDGIRWALADVAGPSGGKLTRWYAAWAELKVADLEAQTRFYGEILGLRRDDGGGDRVVFRREPGKPFLVLEPGGERVSAKTEHGLSNAYTGPVALSFEVSDIDQAAAWVEARSVSVLRAVIRHQDWDGADMVVADADGNAVQLVQYLNP